jgi:Undecaprenyl-phosphate glucose phosphotransferase
MSTADTTLDARAQSASDATTALESLESASESGKARRGPFRPELWRNTRQRNAARLRVFYFRGADITGIAALTVLATAQNGLSQWLNAPLINTLPPIVGSILILGLMRSLGLYRFEAETSTALHLLKVAGVTVAGTIFTLICGLAFNQPEAVIANYSQWALGLIGFLLITHSIWSLLVSRWRQSGALTPNVVVVGATPYAEQLILEALKRRDLNVLGIFDDRLARVPDAVIGVPVLGTAKSLMNHRLTPYIDRVVLAIDPMAKSRVRDLANHLGTLPIPLTLLVDTDTPSKRNKALEKLASAPLPYLEGPVDPDRRAFNKRLQDAAIGSLALVLLSPLLLVIGLAIRLDSKGPALFRQNRHGFNQEEIVVWKFRTMKHERADATASRQVTVDDDRVTRLGRFLRATSLDELPQLLNVVRGEMSLVGPRPHAIGMRTGDEESAKLVGDYAHRHRIKPGMTGWAAIHGSRGPLHTADDVHRRVQLDIDYIERQSFWLDIWIMLVTVPVLLGDRMAVR